MRYSLLLVVFTHMLSGCYAQIRSLKKGDLFPELYGWLERSSISKPVRQDSLRKKKVILDFWNIRCKSCIAAMPKMEALQKKFAADLQVILVTSNTKEEVKRIFEKVRIKKPDLPMITGDSVFQQIFPHEAEPFHVWLDDDLKVAQLTFGHNATASNVEKFVRDSQLALLTHHELEGFDPMASLLQESAGRLGGNTRHYSVFIEGLYGRTQSNFRNLQIDTINDFIRFRAVNCPPLNLYSFAYDKELYGFNSVLGFSTRNYRILYPASLSLPADSSMWDDWRLNNLFTYELKMSGVSLDEFYEAMQQDLERYLPSTARIEDREVECLVLKDCGLKSSSSRNQSAGSTGNGQYCLNNEPITALLKLMTRMNPYLPWPVIDRTGISDPVSFCFAARFTDIEALRKSLNKIGLDIAVEKHRIPMLVVESK